VDSSILALGVYVGRKCPGVLDESDHLFRSHVTGLKGRAGPERRHRNEEGR
jgi:hypothetical protein